MIKAGRVMLYLRPAELFRRLHIRAVYGAAVWALMFAPGLGSAQEEVAAEAGVEESISKVVVDIRNVLAAEKSDAMPVSISAELISKQKPRVDSRLRDLESKFAKLPYLKFSLVGHEQVVIGIKRKGSITLADGHSLFLRPLYADPQRVGMWIRWDDRQENIIDTRMHFNYGESVIIGADASQENGRVLVIRASPLP
ncbi:MAG: hypothetical protein DCC75_05365 [Proteobacteria bacterium]|nr:MAG: hypothetical protein DCC75_05365 [Pseudomonadota bacterium]